MKHYILYLIISLWSIILSSCVSTGSSSGMNGITAPSIKPTRTHYLTGTPTYGTAKEFNKFLGLSNLGTNIDLKGAMISGKKLKHPSNSQNENAVPLKLDIDDLQLRNGIIDDIPGGIILKGKRNLISGITFTNSGEDFLSNYTSRTKSHDPADLIVSKCKFYNDKGGDKSLQFNNASNVRVDHCLITGGITGIRLQESSDKKKVKCSVTNTEFKNVDTAMNIGGATTVTLGSNTYSNVRMKVKKSGDKVKVVE